MEPRAVSSGVKNPDARRADASMMQIVADEILGVSQVRASELKHGTLAI